MAKILLDYVFPISVIEQITSVDTGFLKKVAVVVKPDGSQPDYAEITNKTQIATYTANQEVEKIFDAGLNRVTLILSSDLDLVSTLDQLKGEFYTLLISGDYDQSDIEGIVITPEVKSSLKKGDITFNSKLDGVLGDSITVEMIDDHSDGSAHITVNGQDITIGIQSGVTTAQAIQDAIQDSILATALIWTAIDTGQQAVAQVAFSQDNLVGGVDEVRTGDQLEVGTYDGIVGIAGDDAVFLKRMVTMRNRVGFYADQPNDAENMFHAFGKLLSSTKWRNQQYIEMIKTENVNDLGHAENLFDDKISFVISDDEFGTRLALFSCNKKSIIAPYIIKEIAIKLQFEAMSWINFNSPQYTIKEASLLESYLQERVIDLYVSQALIDSGEVEIKLLENNFVADGEIDIPTPTALWRVKSEMKVSN